METDEPIDEILLRKLVPEAEWEASLKQAVERAWRTWGWDERRAASPANRIQAHEAEQLVTILMNVQDRGSWATELTLLTRPLGEYLGLIEHWIAERTGLDCEAFIAGDLLVVRLPGLNPDRA